MNEGAPKTVESNDSVEGKVKSLEKKIKGLRWHKRIAYALAMVGALGFANEKLDNVAHENAKDVIREKLAEIENGVNWLEANDINEEKTMSHMLVELDVQSAKEIGALLDHDDKTVFERMISSAEALD